MPPAQRLIDALLLLQEAAAVVMMAAVAAAAAVRSCVRLRAQGCAAVPLPYAVCDRRQIASSPVVELLGTGRRGRGGGGLLLQ